MCHAAGDELLKSAAVILQKSFGDYDIYRVGGDEKIYDDKKNFYLEHPELKYR